MSWYSPEFTQGPAEQRLNRESTFEIQASIQSDTVSQTISALEALNPYYDPQQFNPDIPSISSVPQMQPQGQHHFVFDPSYVLAYGPFEATTSYLDSSSIQSFNYRIYLHPSSGHFDPQGKYVYGGSCVHPAQLETYPEMLPPVYFLEKLDNLNLQFLEEIIRLFRHGTPPEITLHIPHELMGLPTWIGPNNLGNIIHHLPHIEALLHIATSYVHHPMGTYSRILRRIHPDFDSSNEYLGTCVCMECNQVSDVEEEEIDELMSEWSNIDEESINDTTSPSSSIESFSILRPRSAPPQLPSSPRTRLHEILEDGKMESQNGNQDNQPENSILDIEPIPRHNNESAQHLIASELQTEQHVGTLAEDPETHHRAELLNHLIKELQHGTVSADPMETNIHLHEILGILQAVQAPDVSNSPQSPSDKLSTSDQREDNTTAYPTPTISSILSLSSEETENLLSPETDKQERLESELVEGHDSVRRGISGTDVGILGYGPFSPSPTLLDTPSNSEYRLYLHQTTEHDTLDLLAYGGSQFKNDEEVLLFRLPTSPYVRDYSLDISDTKHAFFEEVEGYLSGERHSDGVPIPQHLLGASKCLIPGTRNDPQYRFPELVISTIAAQFSRTTTQQGLEGLRHLILPT